MEHMAITSEMIKALREKTGAGMMDCKRALESTGGDMEAAIDHLRKKGAAVAQKRADRLAKEGTIVTRVSTDGKIGVILEVNSETDFVGRSDDFTGFAHSVAEALEQHRPASVDELLQKPAKTGKKIADLLNDLLAKVGENVGIRRFHVYQAGEGAVSAYTHVGNKIGVLVEVSGGAAAAAGRDLAMQIAAMNPMVISRDQVPRPFIDRELDIYRTQARNEKKPEQIVERIAGGRLEKYFQEVCLLEQTFIRDPGKTIKDHLQETASAAGTPVVVKRFVRFHLGEETQA
jgi:elongation factor Ts